jgi:hypothetical protein
VMHAACYCQVNVGNFPSYKFFVNVFVNLIAFIPRSY